MRRRWILSTLNVKDMSVVADGVRRVHDLGWAKKAMQDLTPIILQTKKRVRRASLQLVGTSGGLHLV